MSKLGKRLSQFWYNALKKIIFKDVYQKIEKMGDIQAVLDLATVAVQRLTESADKFEIIRESADQISEISKEKKRDYEEFQISVKHHRQLNKDLIRQFLIANNNQTHKFMKQLSKHIMEKNNKLLVQISQKTNHQLSAFIEQISHELNKQSSVFITQNSKLTKEILDQSLKNHGTINEKFQELVMYPFIVTFRENLITVKTTLIIFEKLDAIQSKIFRNLYLKYHRLHPEIPVLDMTKGIIIIKILFPSFFAQMLKNLSYIKSQLDDDTLIEMTSTIKSCDSFFQNFNKSKLKNIKINLDSYISTIDEIIIKLIDA